MNRPSPVRRRPIVNPTERLQTFAAFVGVNRTTDFYFVTSSTRLSGEGPNDAHVTTPV